MKGATNLLYHYKFGKLQGHIFMVSLQQSYTNIITFVDLPSCSLLSRSLPLFEEYRRSRQTGLEEEQQGPLREDLWCEIWHLPPTMRMWSLLPFRPLLETDLVVVSDGL